MPVKFPIQLTPGRSALVLASSREETVNRPFLDLLGHAGSVRKNVLAVVTDHPPGSFVVDWRDRIGAQPNELSVVGVGKAMRSASAAESSNAGPGGNVVRGVEDPQDLDAVVDLVGDVLDGWATAERETVVYVSDLAPLLERTGVSRTSRFLIDLREHLRTRGCIGYFQLDVEGNESAPVTALSPVFDVVLERSTDGETRTWKPWRSRPQRPAEDDARMPSLENLFDTLQATHRRVTIQYLLEADGPVSIEDLARKIAASNADSDGVVTDDVLRRVYTGLYHVHLPKLANCNLVSIDERRNTVEPLEAARRLTTLLEVASTIDRNRIP